MIFKTIKDDVTGANKSIGLFGLSLNDVSNKLYDIQTKGLKNTLFNTPTIEFDEKAITLYNQKIEAGATAQDALTIASKNTNSATIAFMQSANGATISTEQMVAAQEASTFAARAQSAAYKAVSIAANMIAYALIAKGLQLAADAIDHYVNRAKYAAEAMEEAQQAIDDAQSSLKNVFTILSENKDRFLELSQGVDKFSKNLSLSEEDYAEYLSISNQLAELSPSLVSGYDEQGNALLTIGSNADETNEKLQSILDTQKAISQQTLIDNMDDVANGIYYEVEEAKESISDMESELSSLQQQYEDFNIDIANSDGIISFGDDDYSKYGKAMEEALTSAGIEFEKIAGLYDTSIQLVSASPEQLEQAQKFYDAWLETENEYYHASENGLKQDIEEKENAIETSYAKMTANLQAWVKDNYNYQYLSDSASAMVDALVPEIKWNELEEPPMTAYDYQSYVEENIIKPLMEVPQEHKQEIDNMFQQLLSFEDGDLDVLDFAQQLQEELNAYGIEIDITPIIANEQEAKDKLQSSIESIAEGGSSDFTTSSGIKVDADDYKKLQEYTKDFNEEQVELWNKVTLGETDATEAIEKYEEALKSAQGQSSDGLEVLSTDELEEQLDSLNSAIDEIQSAFNTLQSAVDEYNKQGYLSLDTLQSLMELDNAYLACLVDENGQLSLNADSMNALAQAKLNEAEATAVAQAITELQAIANDEATTSTANYVSGNAELIKSLALLTGQYDNVANAAMTAAQAQALSASIDAASEVDEAATEQVMAGLNAKLALIRSTASSIKTSGLGSVSSSKSSSSSSTKDAWKEEFEAQYDLLKHNLEMEYITEEQYYTALNTLNEKYFANNAKYTDEYRKYQEEIYKGLQKVYKDYIENNMSYLEKALDANKISFGHYSNAVKKMLDDMWHEGKISAEQYWSYTQKNLEKQLDIYDSVISAVTTLYDNEIDKLQDSIDAIEEKNEALEEQQEKMESAINAVVTYYDSLIDKENDSIKTLEDKNDSIQSQIDKYDSLISVADRLYEDEQNALKEQQDAIQDSIDAINDENSALDLQYRKEQAIYNLRKAETQRTKKVLVNGEVIYTTDQSAIRDAQDELQDIKTEELVNQLEKEKDALQESIDALQEYRDALNEIGDSYNRVEDERNTIELLGVNYKDKILGVNINDWERLKNRYVSANDEMADNTNLIDSLNQKIDLWEKEKEQWSSLTKSIEDETDIQNAIELFGADWEQQINEGRFNAYEQFKNNYLGVQSQINDNTELINSYNEKINYYNGLKEQWSSIANVYNEEQNRLYAAQVLGASWESDVLSGRLETLTNFKKDYVKLQQDIADAAVNSANAVVEANKNAAASVTTTPTTISSSSGGSSGGSGGGTTTTSTPKPYWTYRKYGSGYSTQSEATSKIGYTSGANGVAQSGGKWYVVKFLEGYDNNTEAAKATLKKKESDKKNRDNYGYYKRYASGTTNAKKGLNLVGEAGTETYIDNDGNVSLVTKPSLIEMEGGETVKNAKETKDLLNPDNLVPIETMELPGINGQILKMSKNEFMDKMATVMPNYSSMIQPAIQMPRYDFVNTKQPIEQHNQFNISLPNIHDGDSAKKLMRDLENLKLDALQYSSKK